MRHVAVWLLVLGCAAPLFAETKPEKGGKKKSPKVQNAPPAPEIASPSDRVDPPQAALSVKFLPPDGRSLPLVFLPTIEIVLDSSHSMKSAANGGTKLDVARRAAQQLVKELPDQIPVGLRLYGHWGIWLSRRENANAAALPVSDERLFRDTELVVPILSLTDKHRVEISDWLNWTQPRGESPITLSLLEAARDLQPVVAASKSVVLLSDGAETASETAALRREFDGRTTIHVVPIHANAAGERSLRELATGSRGTEWEVDQIDRLAQQFRGAVPAEVRFDLLDEKGVVAKGRVNGEPISAAPGKYRVQLEGRPAGLSVELMAEKAVEVQLDDAARMLVKTSR